ARRATASSTSASLARAEPAACPRTALLSLFILSPRRRLRGSLGVEAHGRAALDELGLQHDVDAVATPAHAVDEHGYGLLTDLVGRRADGREAGREHLGEDDVVIADHCQLAGHA